MEKQVSKKRKELERELLFYLRYYKELQSRGRFKIEIDHQIKMLVAKLKEID